MLLHNPCTALVRSTVHHARSSMPQGRADAIVMHCFVVLQSNAITVAKGMRLLGMGSGQPNRVNSVRIALEKAADEAEVTRILLITCLLWLEYPEQLPPQSASPVVATSPRDTAATCLACMGQFG